MEYKLKKYDKFEITGRGTCVTIHRDDNEIEGIDIGSIIILEDESKWEVTVIEQFRSTFGIGKNIGVLVIQIIKNQDNEQI